MVHVGVASHYSRGKVCRVAERQWPPRTARDRDHDLDQFSIRVSRNEGTHSPASDVTKSTFPEASFVEGIISEDNSR